MNTVRKGKSVFGGIAIGKLAVYQKDDRQYKCRRVEDTAAELARFEEAKDTAKEQLTSLYHKALQEVGEENAAIFEVHRLMLEDGNYTNSVIEMIETRHVNAEYAVATVGEEFANRFAEMDNEYMRERAVDVKDISGRMLGVLQNKKQKKSFGEEPVILLAEDLTPSETVQLDKSKVLSFVTRYGSLNSHTAILARTMNIPSLVGVDFDPDLNGVWGIVDGYEGVLIVDPDEATLEEYRVKMAAEEQKRTRLQELKGKETITLDGRKIDLYANIGSVEDVENALANDAEGIGLFRSEFLYLEAEDYPSEEVQFAAYKAVAEKMAGKKVIIRTLDIGADKQVEYFQMEKEENPAMGYRAIRICLDRPEMFKTQLRAILRASAYGNVSVLFPMIVSVNEVKQIKALMELVKEELTAEGLPFRECEIGIMIETPAAALISDLLAEEVDFFSVGTNDLTQYALAIDRNNLKLDALYDVRHEAVFRMLQMVVDNGHKAGCRVGICGELGADTTLTEELLKMGFDELSVSPSMILTVREAVRQIGL